MLLNFLTFLEQDENNKDKTIKCLEDFMIEIDKDVVKIIQD